MLADKIMRLTAGNYFTKNIFRPWGELVWSVSDEGGFWRARHPCQMNPAARAIKPTEVGDTRKHQNSDETIANKG
jgi:hypothetical protein